MGEPRAASDEGREDAAGEHTSHAGHAAHRAPSHPTVHPVPARPPRTARRRRRSTRERVIYAVVWLAAAAPGFWLGWQLWLAWNGLPHDLGEEPVKGLEHETGEWAIRFLALTLAVSPVRHLTKWNGLVRYRRTLGLFTFWYASLHLATFAALDLELQFGEVATEIMKRPYITVGFVAWLLLVPLAVTSTTGWIRRLGGRRWNLLHRLTYVIAVLGMLHYFWSQKKDVSDPALFAVLFGILFGWRIWRRIRTADRPAMA